LYGFENAKVLIPIKMKETLNTLSVLLL